MRPADDASPARWLLESAADWWRLVRYGPSGLEAYVRVAFAATTGAPGPEDDSTERKALEVLEHHTATPSRAYAAIWEGWTSSGPAPAAPRVEIPNRPMLLFQGAVSALRDAPSVAWYGATRSQGPAPHLAWPQDRAWCLACEVDEEIEFTVGCSKAAADSLASALPGAVRRVGYGDDAPLYREPT